MTRRLHLLIATVCLTSAVAAGAVYWTGTFVLGQEDKPARTEAAAAPFATQPAENAGKKGKVPVIYNVEKLLTKNLDQRYLGAAAPVDIMAEGKLAEETMPMINGEPPAGPAWKAGEEVAVTVDFRAVKVVKSVHIRFGGGALWKGLAASADRRDWLPMEAAVNSYGNGDQLITWYEAVDFAIPARYLRLLATAGEKGFSIHDLRVYGADSPDEVSLVDGVYAVPGPAVAGTAARLNVVVANTSAGAMRDLRVTLGEEGLKEPAIGTVQKDALGPGRSTTLAIAWHPVVPKPHRIVATVGWADEHGALKQAEASFVLPVVNRRLYFVSGYRPGTFEGSTNFNVFNGYPYWDPGLTRIIHRRGGLQVWELAEAEVSGVRDVKKLVAGFVSGMDQSDGMSINEYKDDDPDTIKINAEALIRARAARPDKFIAPWSGSSDHYLDLFRTTANLVLVESYMSYHGPKCYEDVMGSQIRDLRENGISDRAVLVQGIFGEKQPLSLEDVENSVRFVRHTAPEIPGMGFYGGFVRGPWAEHYALCDKVCYRYCIAPVITPVGQPIVRKGVMIAVLHNIGGMNALGVRIAAVERKTEREIARSDAVNIPADGSATLMFLLPEGTEAATVDMRILPSEDYTALQYVSPLGLLARQRAAEGGMGVQRVAFISRDDDGTESVPDKAWRMKDDTPPDARDDYQWLARNWPQGGAFHPSVVLDLGATPSAHVIRIRCRGIRSSEDEAQCSALLKGIRIFVSEDNKAYLPVRTAYRSQWGEKRSLLEINGLKTRSRYIKINGSYEFEGNGIYWVPTIPEGLDTYYNGGDDGLVGWDVYLQNAEGNGPTLP